MSNCTLTNESFVGKVAGDAYLDSNFRCRACARLAAEHPPPAPAAGIGKSFYLLFLMYTLVRESKAKSTTVPTIFYKTREAESFLLLPDGNVMKSTMTVPVFTRETGVPNYVLIDSVLHSVDLRYGPHILVASNTKYFKEFQKRMIEVGEKGKKIYMDQWSSEELRCISPYHLDILNLRYDIFGGSARNFKLSGPALESENPQYAIVASVMELFFGARVHDVSEEEWTKTKASIACAIVEQLNIVEESISSQEAFSSMFYQTLPTGQLTWATTFLKHLAGKILDTKALSISERLQQIIGSSGMGIVFEYQGHEALLKSKSQYRAKSIVKYQKPANITFRVPDTLEVFRSISDISKVSESCYGVPAAGNFPYIDSIMQPDTLFQFTISNDHPGIFDKTLQIRGQLRETNQTKHRLVFVVPKELLGSFQKQDGYGDIKQYVMTYPTFHAGRVQMEIDASGERSQSSGPKPVYTHAKEFSKRNGKFLIKAPAYDSLLLRTVGLVVGLNFV
eukprot:gene26699-32260_t